MKNFWFGLTYRRRERAIYYNFFAAAEVGTL
jgi:hypothetical protein